MNKKLSGAETSHLFEEKWPRQIFPCKVVVKELN